MSTAAENGVLIYSKNLQSLADFYIQIFSMTVIRKTSDFIALKKNDFNLIIHTPPFDDYTVSFCPVKLFMTVDDFAIAREQVQAMGGKVFDGEWSNPIFKVTNVADSDGNMIQLRTFISK